MSNYALRLPESLKQAAKRIAEKISAMETAKFFEKRAASVDTSAALAAWEKVGDHAPMAGDNWTKPLSTRAP